MLGGQCGRIAIPLYLPHASKSGIYITVIPCWGLATQEKKGKGRKGKERKKRKKTDHSVPFSSALWLNVLGAPFLDPFAILHLLDYTPSCTLAFAYLRLPTPSKTPTPTHTYMHAHTHQLSKLHIPSPNPPFSFLLFLSSSFLPLVVPIENHSGPYSVHDPRSREGTARRDAAPWIIAVTRGAHGAVCDIAPR